MSLIAQELEQDGNADRSPTERLVYFSDAVIAIAITLLVLELPVPHGEAVGEAWRSLGEAWQEYLGFLISFIVIGTQWLNHNAVFRNIEWTNRRLGQLNLLWLLTVVVNPFATKLLVSEVSFPMAFTLYAILQALAAVVLVLIMRYAQRHELARPGTSAAYFRVAVARTLTVAAAFLLAIPVAYFTHWAYAIWWAIPTVVGFIRRRRATQSAAA
ncbi:TMEM175 family protein [Winogradskya consettensis]|uniref:DUF1211 domain-containing membrane protein n=1 Tax=Winogradskya consettensis TaxID=113560 RepID=A0A919SVZ6_9ACTN|nr:TMEM175 family protein [Actinoplanes consettensis]GIM79875.1 DUF1211 domain-containing membrane protein [Actinoplanes consettensis]